MPETEIDHRLYTIRELANRARNGHPINVGHLANEILTLDSMLSAGATPPEAWREGPDAPELDGELDEDDEDNGLHAEPSIAPPGTWEVQDADGDVVASGFPTLAVAERFVETH